MRPFALVAASAAPQGASAPESRLRMAVLLAALFTVSLFWAMHSIINVVSDPAPVIETVPIGFLREIKPQDPPVKPKLQLPEPKKMPPPPKMNPATEVPDKVPPTQIPMPRLDGLTDGAGPYVPGDGGSRSTGDRELIVGIAVAPQYPRQALRDGIHGWVDFEIVVNPNGTVKSARVTDAQPRGVFESAATAAIMKWKFRPKVVDGRPQEHTGTQRVEFKLEDEK